MVKRYGLCFLAILLISGFFYPVTAQNLSDSFWINPAYRGLVDPEDLNFPSHSTRSSRQYTCISYDCLVDYLRQNYQSRNDHLQITIQWNFQANDAEGIVLQAMEDARTGNDYLKYSIVGKSWQPIYLSSGNATYSLGFTYVATYSQEEQVNQRVDEILETIITSGMNDEEKEKAIHDWIANHVEYDYSKEERSAYSALFLGKTVCQGYSLLMYKMLEESGVPARIVNSEAMDHAWNMVYLCGNWYHVDVTWADQKTFIYYGFYNLSDAEMERGDDPHFGWRDDVPDAPVAPISYVEGVCEGGIGKLIWATSKSEAVSLALAQGKSILLMAGRPTCPNCQYMKETVCESNDPPIRDAILNGFIPWFCDVDESTEWYPYASGLGSFTLPLICRIDPANPDQYLDRTTSIQQASDFYERLRSGAFEKGDVNHRDGVNLEDAVLALQAAVGVSSGDVFTDADVNGDDRIGIIDAIYVLQKVARLRQ
ncbi:MAG: transglutaminase domain-containing protein [Desulfococcaceae bacterium]